MKKYARIIDEATKQVQIGVGCSDEYYIEIGMTITDVEQAYNGKWYVLGFTPKEPEPTEDEIKAQTIAELKAQLAATDYAIIKIAEGAATRDDYTDIIAQRQIWRAEINELEK